MTDQKQSNWRAAPSFNKIYDNLPTCVMAAVAEFGHRQRTQFVVLRHRINSTWAMMPWAQYRHLQNDHPANPSTICFFGTFMEFRQICLAFPPDLFSELPEPNSLEADPDIPPFTPEPVSNPDASPDLVDPKDDGSHPPAAEVDHSTDSGNGSDPSPSAKAQ